MHPVFRIFSPVLLSRRRMQRGCGMTMPRCRIYITVTSGCPMMTFKVLQPRWVIFIITRVWDMFASDVFTVNGLIFVGYQFSLFSWRVQFTNSSTHKLVSFCMNYEGKYYGHEFQSPRTCHFGSIHENWYPRK